MNHPFTELEADYANCLAHMSVTRPLEVDAEAKKILKPENLNRYLAAVSGTGIPAIFIGTLDLRESNCNPNLALGQGDPWREVSHHVPRGFGPWSSWAAAAKFYINYDHLDDNTQPWSMEYACWKGEAWNGFGPRAHGRRTGYLWSGTSLYDPPTGLAGKYVADGQWSSSTVDVQLGIIPVLLRIAQIRPDLAIGSSLPLHTPGDAPPVSPPALTGTGFGSTVTVQHMLNVVMGTTIAEDGNYGRITRGAVRTYQLIKGLPADGLCGPITTAALEKDFAAKGDNP